MSCWFYSTGCPVRSLDRRFMVYVVTTAGKLNLREDPKWASETAPKWASEKVPNWGRRKIDSQ